MINLNENQKIEAIKVICLILLSFIAFAAVFIRPTLFGFDSYASLLCVQGDCSPLGMQPLAIFVFENLVYNVFLFKAIMFVCFFATILALWFISKLFFGERIAWLSIFVLLALSPVMLFSFGNFENEIFAWPLLFWGFYCLLQPNRLGKWLAFPLLGISCLFWGGGAYFLIALLPFYPFNLLLIPFLMLGIGFLLKKFDVNPFKLMLACFFLIICWQIAFMFQQPTSEDFKLINETKQLQLDSNLIVYNDWSVGYWLNFVGVDTNLRGGGFEFNYLGVGKPFIALTSQELDCNKINSYQSVTRSLNLYKCT